MVVRPSKTTVRDFEGGTGACMGMASPVCGGFASMWSPVCWEKAGEAESRMAAVRITSFMGEGYTRDSPRG